MNTQSRWHLHRYVDVDGSEPFTKWLKSLDRSLQRRVIVALARLEAGNFSSVKWVGGNLGEYRMDTGPGYRIYFTRSGQNGLVLLIGGDKGSQNSDIRKAKVYSQRLKG